MGRGAAATCILVALVHAYALPNFSPHAVYIMPTPAEPCHLQMGRGAAAACILDALVDAYALPPAALLHGRGPACVWSSPPGNRGNNDFSSTNAPELSLLRHVAASGSPDAARALTAWAERR
jgi:hypothetical protein